MSAAASMEGVQFNKSRGQETAGAVVSSRLHGTLAPRSHLRLGTDLSRPPSGSQPHRRKRKPRIDDRRIGGGRSA
jgi:hypothetical protein